ncbi:MipA/OmpV family protein [Aureimonas glaciei]|uniref:MltA-interacting MipA family protein n=1 Tax=Aureimonas glaciei TaxID=1776957 RepID=A0A916Y879_9HYPH|nr:MipA/OmpV family protein [Aureimonas glaciei]GGD34357.1 MltA-interacting MipA family protein [Aureimonas glaciei]
MTPRSYLLATTAFLSISGSTFAADVGDDETLPPEAPAVTDRYAGVDLVFEIGAGGMISPKYEGSDKYEVSPSPIIGFGYLNIPGLFEIGSTGPETGGLDISPSFNMIGERKAEDFDALKGLGDVDATYEVGIKLGYEWEFAEIYGEARYAFGGVEDIVGEAGANLILRPTPELELKAGPFATFAGEKYTETYFGVTAAQSANTGFRLDPYDPKGGIKSVGVNGSARYEFRPDWFLNADASYSQLVGDVADSPIVKAGDENQFTFGLGLSKRFTLDLF